MKIIAYFFLVYGIIFGFFLLKKAFFSISEVKKERGSFPAQLFAEAMVFFLSTMGFPDFVMNTLTFRKFSWVEDRRIPPTLVAAAVTPGTFIAFSYLHTGSFSDLRTLLTCMAAAAAGSFFGSRAVTGLDGKMLRRIVSAALAVSMVLIAVKMAAGSGVSGSRTELGTAGLCIAACVIVLLSFLNMFGVPMKPSLTALFLLLGLSPMTAITLMLVISVTSPVVGGITVMRNGQYHKRISVAAVTAGTLGAAAGSLLTFSMDAAVLNVILLLIMGLTILSLNGKGGSR